MAAGDITIGRRVTSIAEIERPGDYCGPIKGYTSKLLSCFFLKPNARDANPGTWARRYRSVQHVDFPPHTYRECEDGSLEIRRSIGDTAGADETSDGWHGYLDEGHRWRQV